MNAQAPKRSIFEFNPNPTIMKTSLHHLETLALLAALTVLAQPAGAASATWLASPTDGNWEAAGSENNWSTGVATWPGGTSTSSGDTATFNSASTATTITIGGSAWNLKNVTFDTASCAAYTINSTESAASPRWTGGGAVTINSTVTQPQVFSGNQYRLHSGGGLSLINNSATATATLTFSAGIKANNSTSANTFDQAVNLQGTHTGNNTFSGVIADYTTPAAGQWAAVAKSGAGAWYLTANNTYTGPTSITGGSLILSGSGAINGTTNVTISGSGALLSFNNAMKLTTALPGPPSRLLAES
jgi:autotransporter-associated beta strand protein